MQIPPQMMFLHQGQKNIKELRFHPQYGCVMATTAEDSFNVFKPNLEPVDSQDSEAGDEQNENIAMSAEESKQASETTEESKR